MSETFATSPMMTRDQHCQHLIRTFLEKEEAGIYSCVQTVLTNFNSDFPGWAHVTSVLRPELDKLRTVDSEIETAVEWLYHYCLDDSDQNYPVSCSIDRDVQDEFFRR